MNKIIIVLVASICLFSCATKKQIVYFQGVEELNLNPIDEAFEPVIEPNDILYITVSALDGDVTKPFKRINPESGASSSNNLELQGYLVDSKGNINFPVLGKIPVMGKSRGVIEEDIKSRLSLYVKDVVVDVRIINFKITVMGEVNNPGIYKIENERITLPEAIALAGDFSEFGDRREVTVIRTENEVRKVTRIDFTKTDFFSSPYYFLKQNDLVYIEPSQKGVKKTGFIPDVPAVLSLFTIVLSTVILLTR